MLILFIQRSYLGGSKMVKFIKCREDLSPEELQEKLASQGIKVLKKSALTGIFKIEVPEEVDTAALKKTPPAGVTIEEIYDDFPVRALLDKAVPKVRANKVWEANNNYGENTIIGICDTGVDQQHPDIAARIVATQDFTGEGDFDGNGHGTHVATIAIGDGKASNGKYRGAAPAAKLLMAKGLKSDGNGTASDIVDGIEWLFENGAKIISLSLGGDAQPGVHDILQVTCEAVVDKGVAVFCAAGNSGPAYRSICTPGVSPKVITVGASDERDRVANFSSRGPTYEGIEKPDVVAPGVNIIAGRAKNTSLGNVIDQYYTELSGTSMATPLAAGCGLLVLKEHPDLSPENLKARFEGYAVDLGTGDDNIEGEGRIDAYSAVTETQPPPREEPEPSRPGCFFSRWFQRSPKVKAAMYIVRDRLLLKHHLGVRLVRCYYGMQHL